MSKPGKRNSKRIAPSEPPQVAIDQWGQDHWSTFAYAETCVVDRANAEGTPYTGRLNLDKLRCNPTSHAEWIGRVRAARGMTRDWKSEYGTRLKGFHKDNSKRLPGHDDWNCLFDMQRENLLTVVDPRNGIIRFTDRGIALAAHVRAFKIRGGNFAAFAYEFEPSMLIEHKPKLVKPGELTEKDIQVKRCYEAKRMSFVTPENLANDRQVLYINQSRTEVQYDSPTLKNGMHYPMVSMEKFVKWARRDVTDLMTKGEWRTYAHVKGK
jgi:hypothetical protein